MTPNSFTKLLGNQPVSPSSSPSHQPPSTNCNYGYYRTWVLFLLLLERPIKCNAWIVGTCDNFIFQCSDNISTQSDGAIGSLPLSPILRKKSVFALNSMQSPRQIIPLLKPSFYEISNKRGIEQKEWAARYKRYCAEIVTCHSQNLQISLELEYKRWNFLQSKQSSVLCSSLK